MSKFVELDRQFATFEESASGEADLYRYWGKTKSWGEVLANRCTVIIAEGGTGKTAEFRHQAAKLRAEGNFGFFCRIELLATVPLSNAIEIGKEELEPWKNSSELGIFFLDSVDEARLVNPLDFERAIVNFIDAIESVKDRVTVVISTRPHAWRAVHAGKPKPDINAVNKRSDAV